MTDVIELIENYLRTRGVRYFRGHHDREFFFLVDVHAGAGRLFVHLEDDAEAPGTVRVSVNPDRFYPAAARDLLLEHAAGWGAQSGGGQVAVYGSSDPALVGVTVTSRDTPADLTAVSGFVDRSIASAIGFFGRIAGLSGPSARGRQPLADAG